MIAICMMDCFLLRVFADQVDELIEEIPAVVWPRRRLGVILDGEGGSVLQPDPFYRPVIQVHMRHLHVVGLSHGFRINTKAMVLCGDLAAARDQVLHRMVKSPMTMVHLKGGDIIGQRKQLMTETDAKQRLLLAE